MGNNKIKIIIKISEINQTKALASENIIHQDAWKATLKLIETQLKFAESYNPYKVFDRFHNTISINGERGAGKTTFLLTLNKYLKNNDDFAKKVHVLPILDPTLISTKQHVLLLIITAIKEEVEKTLRICNLSNTYPGGNPEEITEETRDKWLKSLQQLAEGLNQIDNIGNNPLQYDLWDDAGLVVEKGLEIAKAGMEFERNFHKFIYESLNILDKKAFILFLDDIDTDFSKGWEILETLRKYITTPQILPIMAGNPSLYEKLVRTNRWKLFEELAKFEDERKQEMSVDIGHLTRQYIMKILQPTNMINLHKFSYYLFYQRTYDIKVSFQNQGEKDIKDAFETIFKKFYKYYYKREYMETISELPLRTVILYLSAYKNNNEEKGENSSEEKIFIQKNKDIFFIYLSDFNLDLEFFDIARGEKGIYLFTLKFFKKLSYEEIKDFKPIFSNINKNILLLLIPQYFNVYLSLDKYMDWGLNVILPFYLNKVIEEDKKLTKYEESLDSYINNFEKPYLKLSYLQALIYETDILILQIYKHKKGLNNFQKKYKVELTSNLKPLSLENLKESNKDISLKSFFISMPLVHIPYYSAGENRAFFSPIDILYFFFLFLNVDNNKEEILRFIKTKLNNFIEDIEDEEQNEEKNNIQENKYSKLYGELLKLSEGWLDRIKNLEIDIHLLEFNKIFANYLEYNHKKIKTKSLIKEKKDTDPKPKLEIQPVSYYFKITIFNFINEFVKQRLEREKVVAKRLLASIKNFSNNLKILQNTLGEENNFVKFIELMTISPIFLPYYYDEISEDFKNSKYKNFSKDISERLNKLIDEIYGDQRKKIEEISQIFRQIIPTKEQK